MQLMFKALPSSTKGIYNTAAGPNSLPERFRKLWPNAADSFALLEQKTGGLIYSDIRRSAIESLEAMRTKAGVQRPGWSGHNYGLSVDVAVDYTLRLRGWAYADLLQAMGSFGWYCHRRDQSRGAEDWHFNYLGLDGTIYLAAVDSTRALTWSRAIEVRLAQIYGKSFLLNLADAQYALKTLHLYTGDVDGLNGPLTLQAVRAFQRAWLLSETGTLDTDTQRTLAFVTAAETILP